MALTYVTAGTAPTATGTGTGGASLTPDIPDASTNVGDLLILVVGTKPDTATIVTPTDWLPVPGAGNLDGGGGTTGTDTGPTRCAMFYRISNGAETSVSVTVTNGTSSWGQVFVFRESVAGSKYQLNATSGADSTTGSAWSVTGSSDPGFTTDDHVLVGSSIPTDVTTPSQFTSESISATGATFAAMTELSEPEGTLAGDIGGFVARTTVSSGTSTAAPVFTATAGGTTTNVRGVSIILRIRSAPSVIQRFGSQTTVSTTSQTTAAVDLVASTPVGALQIVAMSLNAAGTGVSTPSGWRRITTSPIINNGSYEHVVVARFRQSGDAASVTFTLNSTSDWAAVASAYTGVYYQDLSDTGTSNSVPWQAWSNTANDTANDALTNTTGGILNEYEDGWCVFAFGERIASPSATSVQIRSTFPIQFQLTEVADVASSGTTKSNMALYDSAGYNVPISNGTTQFFAATYGTASTEKITWQSFLRPAVGIAFDQQATTVSVSDSSTAVVDMPPGLDPGKLMVMSLVTGAATTPTTPDGWTLANTQTDGACSHHVYWKVSQGTGTSATVALGASTNWAALTRSFVGIDITNPFIDTQMDSETATDTTLTTTAITNTDDLGWAISAFGAVSASNGATWGITTSAGAIRENADVSSSLSGSTYVNVAGTHSNTPVPVGDVTFTGTGASSADKVAWSAVLRPAPTGAKYSAAAQPSASATANDATVLTSDVSFIGEEHFGGTTINQTTATVNKPAGTAEGDLMLATIHTNDQTLTATGWTLVDNTLSGAMRSHLYYRIAGASEASSYDFSVGTATIIGAAISVWRNVDETTPLDFEVSSATSGDPVTGPTLVTSVAAKIIHTRQAREASASNPTYTADKGTERFDFGTANTVSYSQALYEESGHTASGSITGASIDCSGSPTNTVSRTIALFPAGGSATSANAGASSATGTANSSSIALSANGGTATLSGTANEPDTRIGGLAPLVTVLSDAEDSSASISASGGSASVTASAENAVGLPGIQALAGEVSVAATVAGSTVAESVAAGHALVAGTVNAPTLDLDASAPAGTADGTVVANASTGSVGSPSGHSSTSVTAENGSTALAATAGTVTPSATAFDVTASTVTNASAPAGTADGTVVANASIGSIGSLSGHSSTSVTAENGSTALAATAGTATPSVAAFDAMASTATDATADAGHADVTGVASSGTGGVGGLAGESAVSSTANAVTTDLDVNAGSASGAAVAENGLIANASSAQSVSVSVAANDPTVSTVAEANAPAGHVAIATVAEGPGAAVKVPAGDSAVTGVTLSPLANAGPLAGWALVSIVPLNQAEAQAGESAVAVTANGASVSTAPTAAPVSLAVVANGSLSGIGASAGHAAVTASASDSLSDAASAAGHASGTSVANNASSAVTATAGHASALVSAENATANTSSSTNAQAGEVSVVGAASSASMASNAFAQAGSVDAVANNATASTVAATDANAGHASIAGTAEGISSAVEANAGTSAIAVTANNATVATVPFVNAPAGEVAANAVANNATASTSCSAQSVAVPVVAENATASTVASESAPAGDASASVATNNATVVIVTNAQLATVAVTGRDALTGITFPAESVVTVGTVEDLAPLTGPIAGTVSVTGSAYDATILVAGSLVALAPMPFASLTEGLKGGPLAAAFPMPEVFMRSTPKGRIILIPARVERRVIRAEDRVGSIPPEDRQTEEE